MDWKCFHRWLLLAVPLAVGLLMFANQPRRLSPSSADPSPSPHAAAIAVANRGSRPMSSYLAQLSWLMAIVEHHGVPTAEQLECDATGPMDKHLDEGFSVCSIVRPMAGQSVTAGVPLEILLECPGKHCGAAFDIEARAGPALSTARSLDLGRGTYTATLTLYDPGNYTLHTNLAYSGFAWATKPCGRGGVCSEGRQRAAEKLVGVTWERLTVLPVQVLPATPRPAVTRRCAAGDGAAPGRWVRSLSGQTGSVHVTWKDQYEWRPLECVLLTYTREEAAQCFSRRQRTHVVMIGDSQMRSFYNCWLDFMFGELPRSKASRAQWRGKIGQGRQTVASLGEWLNTTFLQETSGVATVVERAAQSAADPGAIVFANAGQHDVTYRDVFDSEGSFEAAVNGRVKTMLSAHKARQSKGKLYWVSTAAQNPWPTVGSTSVERQFVAEHVIQSVGSGLWDGMLDLMQLTVGRRDVLQDYFWDERHYGHEVQWRTEYGLEHHYVSPVHFVQVQIALNMLCN